MRKIPPPLPHRHPTILRPCIPLALAWLSAAAHADWTAYNDSAYKAGQVNETNVTTFGLGRSFAGEGATGNLRDFATGEDTGVTVTFTETLSTGSVNSAGDAASYAPGSDAELEFAGRVDLSGNMSYGDSPGWAVDLEFTGLDPAKSYVFVGTADRHGGAGYEDRVTNWRILGAAASTYASSAAAHKVADDAVEFSTGENGAGLVARWTGIDPGPDGTILIRTSHTVGQAAGGMPGAHAYKGYAGGVFALKEGPRDTGPVEQPIEITGAFPADGSGGVSPNAPVSVVLKPGDHAAKPSSIVLKLDSVTVTPLITSGATGTTVTFPPPAMLAPASTHSVELTFTDDSAAAKTYSKSWAFTVVDYTSFPLLSAGLAVPLNPAAHTQRGFALKIAAPDPNDGIPITNIDEAQAIWELSFNNLIEPTLLNSRGYLIEPTTINYQIDGIAIGNAANDRPFPGIAGSGQPGEVFALQAFTLLHLRPGHYHMNLTMRPGFKLFVGAGPNETELPVTFSACTNCGGDDAPWFTDFLVPVEGLYPFRLLFYATAGGASLEWVDLTPTGLRYLVNDPDPNAIAAYLPPDSFGPSAALQISKTGATLTISWSGEGRLQSSEDLKAGSWSDVLNATNPFHPAPNGSLFYRLAE